MNQLELDLQPAPEYRKSLTGVSWNKSHGKWEVRLSENGQRRRAGEFATEKEAHEAYFLAGGNVIAERDRQKRIEELRLADQFETDHALRPLSRAIGLTQGQFAIVDAADYDWLMQWKWFARKRQHSPFYAARNSSPNENGVRHSIEMSRQILGITDPALFVDHRDHDTLDNRRLNLRAATPAQNCRNTRAKSNSTTGVKGVTWCKKSRKWRVRITIDGKRVTVGRFSDLKVAGRVYDELAHIHHGEFANETELSTY